MILILISTFAITIIATIVFIIFEIKLIKASRVTYGEKYLIISSTGVILIFLYFIILLLALLNL